MEMTVAAAGDAIIGTRISQHDHPADARFAGLCDLIRSADPAPGAHTTIDGRRLKVLRASVVARDLGDLGAFATDAELVAHVTAIAPEAVAEKLGLVNDLEFICAPAPLQHQH